MQLAVVQGAKLMVDNAAIPAWRRDLSRGRSTPRAQLADRNGGHTLANLVSQHPRSYAVGSSPQRLPDQGKSGHLWLLTVRLS